MVCYVRLFVLWEHCHMVWLRRGWQLSRRCLSGPGRRAPDSHTPPGGWHILKHTHCVKGCLTLPPTRSLVLTLRRSSRTSLFILPSKTERSSFNHAAQGLEKVFLSLTHGLYHVMQQGAFVTCFLSVVRETYPHVWYLWLFVFAVCNKMTKYRAISPFLCMDMTYITCLLKEGFGFKDSTVLQVSQSEQQHYCGQ